MAAMRSTFLSWYIQCGSESKGCRSCHDVEAIHACEDRDAALQKAAAVAEKLELMRLGKAAEKVRDAIQETLFYYKFPSMHWKKIRTNNPLERIMREIRRRTRVVGTFPDGHSALMLSAARLRHIAGTKWGLQRYMDMEELYGSHADFEMNQAMVA